MALRKMKDEETKKECQKWSVCSNHCSKVKGLKYYNACPGTKEHMYLQQMVCITKRRRMHLVPYISR